MLALLLNVGIRKNMTPVRSIAVNITRKALAAKRAGNNLLGMVFNIINNH